MKIFFKIFAVVFILGSSHSFASSPNLTMVISINPIYQIGKFISGDKNKIVLLVNHDVSEHYYMPKPSDIRNINKAQLVLFVSGDLEYYLPKILKSTNNKAKVVELINSPGLKLLENSGKNNSRFDPHIWLSPKNAVIIAQIIAENLAALDPANSSFYNRNLEKFKNDIDKEIGRKKFSGKGSYIIFHNCYRYFEDYYQISSPLITPYNQSPVQGIADLKKINNLIQKNNIQCVISQPQEENKIAKRIARANNIQFVIADILGGEVNNENGYLKLMNNLFFNFSRCIIKNADN